MSKKLQCIHADTCLSDYWGGHHLAHVAVPVWPGMTIQQLRDALHTEVTVGAVMGSTVAARLLSEDLSNPSDQALSEEINREAHAAIDRDVAMSRPDKEYPFEDLEDCQPDEGPDVMAYFVFGEVEDE